MLHIGDPGMVERLDVGVGVASLFISFLSPDTGRKKEDVETVYLSTFLKLLTRCAQIKHVNIIKHLKIE